MDTHGYVQARYRVDSKFWREARRAELSPWQRVGRRAEARAWFLKNQTLLSHWQRRMPSLIRSFSFQFHDLAVAMPCGLSSQAKALVWGAFTYGQNQPWQILHRFSSDI